MIWLRIGDVFRMDGKLVVCDAVNECAARVVPLKKKTFTITPLVGDPKVVSKWEAPVRVSNQTERASLLARLGKDWQQADFAAVVPGYGDSNQGNQTNNTNAANSEENMKNITTTTTAPKFRKLAGNATKGKARGGLAATPTPATTGSKGKAAPAGKKGATAKAGDKATATADEPRKLSKCAFIDSLLEKGTFTLAQILDQTLAAYPGCGKKATMSTIKVRPSHMRKAGKKPAWVAEPKEQEAPAKGAATATPETTAPATVPEAAK